MQVAGILGLAAIVSIVAHKTYMDVDKLAQKHSGIEFWAELAKQILRNLAAGGGGG